MLDLWRAEVRANRPYDLQEVTGLALAQLAGRFLVGRGQISTAERGDLDSAGVGNNRSFLEAVGGVPVLEYVAVNQRMQIT